MLCLCIKKEKTLKLSHISTTEKSLFNNLSHHIKGQSSGIIGQFSNKTKWWRKSTWRKVRSYFNNDYFKMPNVQGSVEFFENILKLDENINMAKNWKPGTLCLVGLCLVIYWKNSTMLQLVDMDVRSQLLYIFLYSWHQLWKLIMVSLLKPLWLDCAGTAQIKVRPANAK